MEDAENDPNDGDQEEDRRVPSLLRSDSDGDILCSCCFQLMVRPTTLTCGHNICRLCLAQWFQSSKQRTCPTCRQFWVGYPKVNTALRNMILRLHPSVEERERELEEDDNAQKVLTNFEREMKASSASPYVQPDIHRWRNVLIFILVIVATFSVAYWMWNWRHSDEKLLIHKPVVRWKVTDVHRWLQELEWGQQYAGKALEHHIDGTMLLAMDENSIREFFEPENVLHERAFMIALRDLQVMGVKMPSTLWEFKALYPGLTLILTFGMKDFPRTLMFYMYWYYYEDIFVPFVHFSTPHADGVNITFSWSDVPPPSTSQYITFLTNMLLVPYWSIARFAWTFFGIHFPTSLFVMATCLSMTLTEALSIKSMYYEGPRKLFIRMIKYQLKLLAFFAILAVIWPLIPKIFCDLVFYVCLYFSPFQIFTSLRVQAQLQVNRM